jgi:hypothetical protein
VSSSSTALPHRLTHFVLRYVRPAEGQHEGRVVAGHLYGAIIVLAVLITANDHTPHPYKAAAVLAVTVAVLLGMETYAEVIAREITLRRTLTGSERITAIKELLAVTGAAELPLVFLVMAGVGWISIEAAFHLAQSVTIALLFYYGYLARRLAGRRAGQAVAAGAAVSVIGLALALGKGYVHL